MRNSMTDDITTSGTNKGNSDEQRKAEEWMINEFFNRHKVKLSKRKFNLENGSWIELDGYCESPSTLCEAWSHIGTPKSAQKDKVMTDALKLIYLNMHIKENSKLYLLFADNEAAAHFKGKTWMAQCLNIIVEIIELPPELREEVKSAQKRQYR